MQLWQAKAQRAWNGWWESDTGDTGDIGDIGDTSKSVLPVSPMSLVSPVSLPLPQRLARLVPETSSYVIVHHPRRLHVRVDDGAADELEAALLEILAERIRFGRGRRDLLLLRPAILDRLAADERPQVLREAAVL